MASGSYARKFSPQQQVAVKSVIPLRATRVLPETDAVETPEDLSLSTSAGKTLANKRPTGPIPLYPDRKHVIVEEFQPHPLQRHKIWVMRSIICAIAGVLFLLVLLFSSILQRPLGPFVNIPGGKTYDVQVGGNLASTWQVNQPLAPKVTIPPSTGPYSVLVAPSITVDTINQVLAAYHSPAAGKGQTLYDMGVHYGIDPAFALAFFMHESSFGTQGEARSSLSLGNLRCITKEASCTDGYAWFNSWEDGFQAWYELIRNLYVAQWGLTTVDQIIPKYAPTADHNNEAAYIAALKHAIDTWHAGTIMVSA
jgi:Mannosyl-glycoprotein endo-beta-N-acetylglucosaminidase